MHLVRYEPCECTELDDTTIEYFQNKNWKNKIKTRNWCELKKSNQLIWLGIYKSEKSVSVKTKEWKWYDFFFGLNFSIVQISAYYVNVMRVCVCVNYIEPVQNQRIWCFCLVQIDKTSWNFWLFILFEEEEKTEQ